MKRIVFSGYYGLGNTGDEAVLAGAISSFRTLDDETCITALSANPADTIRLHGVDAVNRYSMRDVIRTIRESDIVLSGGGSLLQDITSARSAAYYFAIILVAELLRKPVMIYAQGIGPLLRRATRLQARLLLNRASMITVRDTGSAELLKSLGVVRPPLHLTADPSLALEPSEDLEAQRMLVEIGVPEARPIMGVSLRPWKVDEQWVTSIAAGLDLAAHRIGAIPLFIPMQHPDDVRVSMEVSERMSVKGLILEKPVSPALAKAVVGRTSVMVGMRLHSLIFAAAQATPMVALSYDPKVHAFVAHIPARIPTLDAVSPSPQDVADAVEAVFADTDTIREALNAKLPDWRRDAMLNARLALGLLTSERNNGRS